MINSSSGFNKSKMISRRMFVISVAKIVVFSGIFARLISLQINESKKYTVELKLPNGSTRNINVASDSDANSLISAIAQLGDININGVQ